MILVEINSFKLLRLDNPWVSTSGKYIFGSFVLKNKEAKKDVLKTLSEKKSNPL